MENMDKIQKELDRVESRIFEIEALQKEALKEADLDFCSYMDSQLSPLLLRQEILKNKLNELTLESYKKIKIFG